jgi:hypothetical protein
VDPIHDSKAEVNGVLYHYLLAKGHGDPMVLLHGGFDLVYVAICGARSSSRAVTRFSRLIFVGSATRQSRTRATTTRQWLGTSALSWQSSNSEYTVNILGHDWGDVGLCGCRAGIAHPWATLDVPLPGISPWGEITTHVAFQVFSMSATSPRC